MKRSGHPILGALRLVARAAYKVYFRAMFKKVFIALGMLVGLLAGAGALGFHSWQKKSAEAESLRTERLEEIAKSQARWRSPDVLDGDDACDLLAWHSLDSERAQEAGMRHVLDVNCDEIRIIETNPWERTY